MSSPRLPAELISEAASRGGKLEAASWKAEIWKRCYATTAASQ